jgi:hypothetical protein
VTTTSWDVGCGFVHELLTFAKRIVIIPRVALGLEVVVRAACTMDYYFHVDGQLAAWIEFLSQPKSLSMSVYLSTNGVCTYKGKGAHGGREGGARTFLHLLFFVFN